MSRPRKVHVKSFGCQMNVYDSHRMADTLAPDGFIETASPEDADLVILNTCHIREKAAEKVYSEIGRIREMKEAAARDGRRMMIAVAGCVAQAEGKEIIRRAGAVDLVVGSQNYHRLPEHDRARASAARKSSTPNFRSRTSSTSWPRRNGTRSPSAAFPLSSPCRKAATSSARSASCPTRAAPKSRGRLKRSSPKSSGWPTRGVREVTLIGQNVNAYHGLGPDGRHRRSADCCAALRRYPAFCGCATRPAIRATWTTI